MANMLLVNPRKRRAKRRVKARTKRRASAPRKRRSARSVTSRRARNPIRYARKTRRARRRNPINLNLRSIQSQVMDAATGAAGAVALSVALGYLPIPAQFKTGTFAPVTKGAVAIGLGMLLANVVKGSTAARMTQGALTVILADVMRGLVSQFAPNITLAGDSVDYYQDDAMNAYGDGMGYTGSGFDPGGAMGDYLPDISNGASFDTSMGAYADGSGSF